MTQSEFENLLLDIVNILKLEAKKKPFSTSNEFENRVREIAQIVINNSNVLIDFDPHPQAFPDIAIGEYGIEVKFTTKDTWRSVANSVLERNRIDSVKKIYLVFGKMGGVPDVRWAEYEKSVMHVRTSHVPRFEVEIGATQSLFDQMGVSYNAFRVSSMEEKMQYIRLYARGRLKSGERLWWLENSTELEHSLPIQARLYTKLSSDEKTKLRAEAVLLCPRIVSSGRTKDKYDDVVLYLLTYHGVLCHQARDLFSAGSVANPKNDDEGGSYVARSIKLIESDIRNAALRMEDALFVEYWGFNVAPEHRIAEWLKMADSHAQDWLPSAYLFVED